MTGSESGPAAASCNSTTLSSPPTVYTSMVTTFATASARLSIMRFLVFSPSASRIPSLKPTSIREAITYPD